MVSQGIVEQSGFLDLSLVIALQNDCYEQLQENEAYDKEIAGKIEDRIAAIPTTYSNIACFNVVLIRWICLALCFYRIFKCKSTLNSIP
jgi:hypothetical protein